MPEGVKYKRIFSERRKQSHQDGCLDAKMPRILGSVIAL